MCVVRVVREWVSSGALRACVCARVTVLCNVLCIWVRVRVRACVCWQRETTCCPRACVGDACPSACLNARTAAAAAAAPAPVHKLEDDGTEQRRRRRNAQGPQRRGALVRLVPVVVSATNQPNRLCMSANRKSPIHRIPRQFFEKTSELEAMVVNGKPLIFSFFLSFLTRTAL